MTLSPSGRTKRISAHRPAPRNPLDQVQRSQRGK
jgi:hypothetical protein